MPFCHIYARRDGTFSVRMHGTLSDSELRGTVEYTSRPGCFKSEQEARSWIREGQLRAGLDDMPEPKVIRR